MDEMKIQSSFMKSLISSIVNKRLSKNSGNWTVDIHKLGFVNSGERTTINIGIDLEVNTSDIPKLLEKLGVS